MKIFLRFWVVILTLSGLIACWFVSQAVREGWCYFCLNGEVPAKVVKWDVKAVSSSQYAVCATYSYTVNDQEFTGQTVLKPVYPNRYAAENSLKLRTGEPWRAWYQRSHPTFSSLQKKFPKKAFTNAFLTLGIFIYFCFARNTLRQFQS